jgi:antitoxin ParD1/3/4
MTERTITLTDEDAALLDRLVESCGYVDAEDALHESLKLAALARENDDLRVAAFKAAIQLGIDDAEAGRCTTFKTPGALAAFLDDLLAEPLDEPRKRQPAPGAALSHRRQPLK